MQEDKRPLFDTVDILTACIKICEAMIPKLKIIKEAMLMATCKGFLNATDMADYLVIRGMPFRQAHECVGKAVNFAQDNNKELHELTLKELKTFSSLIKKDVFNILKTEQMINRRKSFGGTAKENVMAAIKEAEKNLEI